LSAMATLRFLRAILFLEWGYIVRPVDQEREIRRAAAKPGNAFRRDRRDLPTRHVHGQPRHHSRSTDADAAVAALDDKGVDRLRPRIQGRATGRDEPPQLDGAVLPRRGDGSRRRTSALLL